MLTCWTIYTDENRAQSPVTKRRKTGWVGECLSLIWLGNIYYVIDMLMGVKVKITHWSDYCKRLGASVWMLSPCTGEHVVLRPIFAPVRWATYKEVNAVWRKVLLLATVTGCTTNESRAEQVWPRGRGIRYGTLCRCRTSYVLVRRDGGGESELAFRAGFDLEVDLTLLVLRTPS